MSDTISHSGIVKEIIDNKTVNVLILNKSACASCSSKKMCSIFEMQEKVINVKKPDFEINIGEEVNVVMYQSFGYLAVILSYALPFVLMMSVITIFYIYNVNDLITGPTVLGLLTAYYVTLYLFRKKLSRKAYFKIDRI